MAASATAQLGAARARLADREQQVFVHLHPDAVVRVEPRRREPVGIAVVDPGHPSWACRVNWWPVQVPELAAFSALLEFYRLGQGKADRWSFTPEQLEVLGKAKAKAKPKKPSPQR